MTADMEDEAASHSEQESGSYHVGDDINWDSQLVPIRLSLELPFWLLTPNGSLSLTVNGCTLQASIWNNGIEIQQGHQFTRTHLASVFLGPEDAAGASNVSAKSLTEGGFFRWTRTLVALQTVALADALAAFQEGGRRFDEAKRYFASLAMAHLVFVNHLVNSYRRLTFDPFATEISQWDVPVWFVASAEVSFPVHVFPYNCEDSLPTGAGASPDARPQAYSAASIDEIDQIARTVSIPGEVELLDGWSLYYRGRYGDSIRSLVTAIEVLLEVQLREELRRQGVALDAVEQRIFETRNNFDKRLKLYCELSGRRVPGPLLSWVPYLNGVRLSHQLEWTRQLRHSIVHAGRRLDHSLIGPMRRAAETATWYFGWLSNEGDFGKRQLRHYGFFESFRERIYFAFEIKPEGVRVVRPSHREIPTGLDDAIRVTSLDIADIPEQLFLRALGGDGGDGRDFEHFALMAFAKLGYGLIDSPPAPDMPLPYFDRFRMVVAGKVALLFLIDTHEVVSVRTIEQIAAAVTFNTRQGLTVDSVVCLINDQNGVPWVLRNSDTIDEQCVQLARALGFSLVKSEDLARLALGVRSYGWSREAALAVLLEPGRSGREPAGVVHVGHVGHFYDRLGVVSVELTGEIPVTLGDRLVYRLRDRYHQEDVASIQQNHTSVNSAQRGRIGVPISVTRSELPVGADVYIMPRDHATEAGSAGQECGSGQAPDASPEGSSPEGNST